MEYVCVRVREREMERERERWREKWGWRERGREREIDGEKVREYRRKGGSENDTEKKTNNINNILNERYDL